MKTDVSTLGGRIAFLRKQKGLTQEELLMILGSGSKTMESSWEQNKVIPTLYYLQKLAQALDTNLDYLANGTSQVESKFKYETYKDLTSAIVRLHETGLFEIRTYQDGKFQSYFTMHSFDERIIDFAEKLNKLLGIATISSREKVNDLIKDLIDEYDYPIPEIKHK